MATNWSLPSIITQYAESGAEDVHLPWDDKQSFSQLHNKDSRLGTVGQLQHIARSPKHDLRNKTYFLKAQGFNFRGLPEVLSGIKLRLTVSRSGRITDETIQLCLGEDLVGDNHASLSLDPMKTYGGETDLWNTSLSITDITTPEFGVVLRFQAHPHWPHRDAAFIDAVEIQIY